jgi:hypothetical protein
MNNGYWRILQILVNAGEGIVTGQREIFYFRGFDVDYQLVENNMSRVVTNWQPAVTNTKRIRE